MLERPSQLASDVIGCAIEVHRALGPGLLESSYEACLIYELGTRGLSFARQVPVPLYYKEVRIDCSYRVDIVVNEVLLIEVKSVDRIQPVHYAQVMTYLKLLDLRQCLLFNFNARTLREGMRNILR